MTWPLVWPPPEEEEEEEDELGRESDELKELGSGRQMAKSCMGDAAVAIEIHRRASSMV
jgi:hypothetical protein